MVTISQIHLASFDPGGVGVTSTFAHNVSPSGLHAPRNLPGRSVSTTPDLRMFESKKILGFHTRVSMLKTMKWSREGRKPKW